MRRAAIVLSDAGAVRWPLTELRLWLNDGLREISLHAPSAVSRVVVIDMVSGTRQTLPDTAAALLRVNCNIDVNGDRGASVTPITRDILDQQIPAWQSTAKLPFGPTVRHSIDDPLDQRTFLVAPGNDGTGKLECLVSSRPTPVALPADPLDPDAYTDVIELDDIYVNALIDYVLYRSFSKDVSIAGAPQRAQAHYMQFAGALGIKMQTEATLTPDTRPQSKT